MAPEPAAHPPRPWISWKRRPGLPRIRSTLPGRGAASSWPATPGAGPTGWPGRAATLSFGMLTQCRFGGARSPQTGLSRL